MSVCNEILCAEILAWTLPDIDVELPNQTALPGAMHSARVAFSVTYENWSPRTNMVVFNAVMEALPLDSIVTLTAEHRTMPLNLNEQFWLRHAPKWPLLRCVCLPPSAARGFREMLLEDNGERECPLFPSLRKLVLVDAALRGSWTHGLCNTLIKRVEQGVPLEVIDLRTCALTNHAVQLLGEIVVDAWGLTKKNRKIQRSTPFTTCYSGAHGLLVQDDSHSGSDVDDDDPNTGGDDEEGDDLEMSYDENEDDKVVEDYWGYWLMKED